MSFMQTVTQKAIGQSFSDELAKAGLTGLPICWGSDGTITGADALTAAQQATLAQVYNAHNSTKLSNSQIQAQIDAKEATQHRAVREYLAAQVQNNATNMAAAGVRIQAIETEIEALRSLIAT